MVAFAEDCGTTMQILEPFIWTFGDSNSILLSSLLLVFLFADMPFLSSGTPLYLARTTRTVWLVGQAIYIAAATTLYMLFILASTALVCMKNSFVGNLWSDTAAMLGYSSAGEVISVPSSVKTMEMSTPYRCAATILLLMLLYTLLMVFLMLLFNLWRGQLAGVVGVFAFSLYGFLLSPDIFQTVLGLTEDQAYLANVIVGWLSPLNQATYQRHNFGYDMLPRLWQSYLIDLALLALCFAGSVAVIRRYNFVFTGTQGSP